MTAADGRTNALAHIAGRKTSGITGDERITDACDLHIAAQVVAVAHRIVVRPLGKLAIELCNEIVPVLTDVDTAALDALGHTADAHVQVAIRLGHVPGIPRHALVKEPQMAVRIAP